MARQRVVIDGDDEFRELLSKLVDGVEDLRSVGHSAGALIAERAARQAPHASGALAADIRVFAGKKNAGIRVGRKRLPYVGPIIGGHGSPGNPRLQGGYVLPNPFIFDAADERAAAVIKNYEDFVDDLAAGKRPKAAKRYKNTEPE